MKNIIIGTFVLYQIEDLWEKCLPFLKKNEKNLKKGMVLSHPFFLFKTLLDSFFI